MSSKPHDDPTYPVRRSESEWRDALEPVEFQVTRHAATERAFTGRYWDHWASGQYRCVCCDAVLFESGDKFDAGCGWPSYTQPAPGAAIEALRDNSYGMVRTEVRCQQCGAHLGHVFEDGPAPTGLRYCINSASIAFTEPEDKAP